jgi:hypothetical protein
MFWGLWFLYTGIGLTLNSAPVRPVHQREVLFEADMARVTLDITSTTGPHWRSNVHPLFVLFANPLGSFFALLLGGRTSAAAIAFNALVGSLTALLSARMFWGLSGANLPRTIIATLIAAFAMSRLFFSSVPETYALSALSVAVTLLVFWIDLEERRLPLWIWVAAGVLSLGVTVTNFAQTFFCFLTARYAQSGSSVRQAALATVKLCVLVVAGVAVLSVVQVLIYPSTGLLQFLQPAELGRESWFVRLDVFRSPWEVLSELFRNFFVFNVVAGIPSLVPGIGELPRLTFGGTWAFSAAGYLALALWAALIAMPAGVLSTRPGSAPSRSFLVGVALCILFNLVLHSFYFGKTVVIEYFLYTSNFTFPVITLVLCRWVASRTTAASWALGAFLIALAINNLDIMRRIIGYYY